jgi:NADH-quinone oxidoreductase subunit A
VLDNNVLEIKHYRYFNSSLFKTEYYAIACFILISLILSIVIISLSLLFAVQKPDTEKLSTYECGFEPYNDSRHRFDIKFYLLAIIFIIFDIETAFLLPLVISITKLSPLGFWSMIDFVFELNFVYVYIWSIGALEWN